MAQSKPAGRGSLASTYMVTYDSANHIGVLTQMWGSIWPSVLPYCLFNVMMMVILTYVDASDKIQYNMKMSAQGLGFITMVVAFLLVSRVNTALGRFTEARDNLGKMYRESRELIQNTCVFTSHATSEQAKVWRQELAYRSLLLLRTSMAVIDYPTDFIAAWDVPELKGEEKEDIRNTLLGPIAKRYSHIELGEWEDTMRVPIRIAYLLRKTIHAHSTRLNAKLETSHENKLHASVDSFMSGYYGMRKFLTTPVPFPMIQMARTFLFLYLLTVPFVMLTDTISSNFARCLIVFLITFGFMGLELVAIQLDNPFGDDANDFDNMAMAMTAFEDTFLTIVDVDGTEWADRLRRKMWDGVETEKLTREDSWLLGQDCV
mmetsp:Transcript_6864/g.8896  ORF Transcript_6864/g.8896 Transcript_6864/m.8896 type:complete len:375 (-) Transcript_6864:91-1215(-)|eukprot:CAMPEP_0198137498 /NCGR_PEP_ID=MMETSP1443-20131203/972_1 /TAXON_ID=186043 /ORGANISM="Entomoneis sp., Strain CCMP2396" /LENGTH=374 /DNA_ID=CAMNT_0043798945 /DNA_START=80 /DNA_END=1204 /DNA_ORIENTATION=-